MELVRDHMEETGPWSIICGWWNKEKPEKLIASATWWQRPNIRVFFLNNAHLKAWILYDQIGMRTLWDGTANFREPTQGNRMRLVKDEDEQFSLCEDLDYFRTLAIPYRSDMTHAEISGSKPCSGPVIVRQGSVTSIGRFFNSYERDQWAQGNMVNVGDQKLRGVPVPGGTMPPPVDMSGEVNVYGGVVTIDQVGGRGDVGHKAIPGPHAALQESGVGTHSPVC
jgi:hypothetical protein